MRSIMTTTPYIVAAVLGLASATAFAQQGPMNGDPDPAWQQHDDGTTSGWQGDRMRPVPDASGNDTEGGRGDRWHGSPHGSDDGYTNARGSDTMRVHHQGNVAFVSGGVGLDESRALLRESARYPLMLSFLGSNREYLSDVRVLLENSSGDEVLRTDARGPFLLARLPSGRYTVRVAYHGREQVRRIAVNAHGHVRSTFVWPTHDD